MNEYQKLSVLYYDKTKSIGLSLGGDLEFYEKEIMQCKHVLEAGVGTGRLLIPYLAKGIRVDGIDLSQDMIDLCASKCETKALKANLMMGDVATFDFQNHYDAIIVPTGTFCLFDDIHAVLRNFYNHLEEGGLLMFDLIFPNEFKLDASFAYPLELSSEEHLVLHDIHQSINWTKQTTTQLLQYDLWNRGKLVESELQTFKLNWYGIKEIAMILEKVGFKDLEFFGDYQKSFDINQQYDIVSVKVRR